MILYVCSILDKQVNAYMRPNFYRTKGEAIRDFMDACSAQDSVLRKHAEDFVFCFVAEYEDSSAEFRCVKPVTLMTALDAISVEGGVN